MQDPSTYPAHIAAALIADRKLTSEKLVRACLERISTREAVVGAWEFIDEDAAIAQARCADRSPSSGLLHGVPIGVKDVIDTVDMPTGYGSALYRGHQPSADASCVALSRAAGAVIMGKTVSTEYAFVSPNKTSNPVNAAHTPGGSSSGSAAAVAAGMVPLAFGTQTSGSTIRPAAFCGIVGYKPSFGLADRTGMKTLATSFDTVGILARNVRDAALLVAVAASRPELAHIATADAPRIGVFDTARWGEVSPASVTLMERAIARLSACGAHVGHVRPDARHADWLFIHEAIMDWEVLQAFAYERLFHLDDIAPATRAMVGIYEQRATAARHDAGQLAAQQARRELPDVFGDHDVLLVPAAPGEAPLGLTSTGDAAFNRAWTMLHVPCVTVPMGLGAGGMPLGLQIVGRPGKDARVLAAAAFVEQYLRDDNDWSRPS